VIARVSAQINKPIKIYESKNNDINSQYATYNNRIDSNNSNNSEKESNDTEKT
jgi:hypothetical protein